MSYYKQQPLSQFQINTVIIPRKQNYLDEKHDWEQVLKTKQIKRKLIVDYADYLDGTEDGFCEPVYKYKIEIATEKDLAEAKYRIGVLNSGIKEADHIIALSKKFLTE